MKFIIALIVGFVLGIMVGTGVGFKFTQDLSVKAVEDVLDNSSELLQNAYSGSNTQGTVQDFNVKIKEQIDVKKKEFADQAKQGMRDYLKKKIDEMF